MSQTEPDTSAGTLQDCEVMSADTSTVEIGVNNGHDNGDPNSGEPTPTPPFTSMTSVYEFEEKDDSPSETGGGNLLRQNSQSSSSMRKRYDKPKKLWMQKEADIYPDDSLDSEERSIQDSSGGVLGGSDRPKRRRRKDRDSMSRGTIDSESGNGFNDTNDNGEDGENDGGGRSHNDNEDDDDDLSNPPMPIKLKICRDPNLSGSYRVVPAGNGTMHTTTGTAPGACAREVECCLTPDSRLLRKGDIVWAKITGYPFWPARVHQMTQETPRGVPRGAGGNDYIARVDWFAWNQCSYIACNKLLGFLDHYDTKFNTKNKNRGYIEAVAEARRCAEQRLVEDSRLAAAAAEKANQTRRRRAAGAAAAVGSRGGRSRGGPRGRPRGSKNRRGGTGALHSTTAQVSTALTINSDSSASQQLIENSHILDGFAGLDLPPLSTDPADQHHHLSSTWPDTSVPLTTTTGAGGLLAGVGLPELLPDLGPLGFVDVMKCDIPTFSDDDEEDDSVVNVVKIHTDKL